MLIVIVDYGSGNLRSAAKAFERAARDAGLGATVSVSDRPETVAGADRVVLPGVGAFGDCLNGLNAVPGLREAITETVIARARPFLGICVGMQLMAERGIEHGVFPGLGWLKGEVAPIVPSDPSLKIPHMGWNALDLTGTDHPVLAGLEHGAHAYFVHSFALTAADPATVLATVDYGGPIVAVAGRDNLVGTQFHPEKSQAVGQRLIRNFLGWRP